MDHTISYPSLQIWFSLVLLCVYIDGYHCNKSLLAQAFPQTSSVWSLLVSSWKMVVPCQITTSRRNPPSTWFFVCAVVLLSLPSVCWHRNTIVRRWSAESKQKMMCLWLWILSFGQFYYRGHFFSSNMYSNHCLGREGVYTLCPVTVKMIHHIMKPLSEIVNLFAWEGGIHGTVVVCWTVGQQVKQSILRWGMTRNKIDPFCPGKVVSIALPVQNRGLKHHSFILCEDLIVLESSKY